MSSERRRPILIIAFIAILLALIGLYSFSTGYRMGSDMARHDGAA